MAVHRRHFVPMPSWAPHGPLQMCSILSIPTMSEDTTVK